MPEVSVGTLKVVKDKAGVERSTGIRTMRTEFLDKLGTWLQQNGFADAAPGISYWLDPAHAEPLSAAKTTAIVKRLKARRGHGLTRENAYLEAAIFCLEASGDE